MSFQFLLPSGFLVDMKVQKNATIAAVKRDLWREMKTHPYYGYLGSLECYYFICIDETSNKIEITDETRRLCDVRPFYPMFKLEKLNDQVAGTENFERVLDARITVLIGKSLKDLDEITEPEVVEFRSKMSSMYVELLQDWLEQVTRYHPPDLVPVNKLPDLIEDILAQNKEIIVVSVHVEDEETSKIRVKYNITPKQLIDTFFEKKSKQNLNWSAGDYVLKVLGLQEYLLGDYPLHQFAHIRSSLIKETVPELVLVHYQSIPRESYPNCLLFIRLICICSSFSFVHPFHSELMKRLHEGTSVFDISDKFSLMLSSSININLPDHSYVVVRACIYHGADNLCGVVVSKERPVQNRACSFNNELFTFDIEMRNIPRMARVCFLLYTHNDKRQPKQSKNSSDSNKRIYKKKDMIPLAWANLPIYDYRGMLRVGDCKLMMWPVTDDDALTDELLNSIGTVAMNTSNEDAASLNIIISRFTKLGSVYFPPFDKVLETAAHAMTDSLKKNLPAASKEQLALFEKLLDRDALHPMCEQDMELIWNMRQDCRDHFPHALPKLLTCVKWNNYLEVSAMHALLQIWSPLEPTDALELLDFQYADQYVRSFAVRCLKNMSDSQLCLYLLQLVQVLKYESYLDCDLIQFLLKRALKNNKIGHNFFWLLRSEMHIPSVSVRFGLILEAYCYGNIYSLAELHREVDALYNLRQLSDHIKVGQSRFLAEMTKGLDKKYKEALTALSCPLNPSVKLKCVRLDKCKCMDSKMKPLWMVWENNEKCGNDMFLMFKKGDDLRQDMLTLQILKIMDNIWQKAGLDLRLLVYNVLPSGQKEGLIEVVTDSRTLAEIQLEFTDITLVAGFNKKCIYQYLQKHNSDPKSFDKAMDVFTRSCAGYSVATYVLGVADRHSDNIMIRKDGQLFHIDFGHILGNFKSKLGVRRERCPFVLTADFVYVIKKGQEKNDFFKKFEKLCQEAFQTLRRYGKFLIVLFMMMMNTGIPEVSCLKDIEYLKETLVPHKTDEEAKEHFKSKFTEALKNSWKTSLNMACHNLRVKKGQESQNQNK
ncbi:hypothetical protein HELRODRAFT_96068 [Helobdella robusta]|uniref:phosphatidylinositol 3-kinase n=1 Tax=Helobdella robusta TaxID=6412 RepID=T1G9A0_HELRO|nr:hypothetical protein HELRODRAFT_96068 [Helobdella robusta]ESN92774.1 hypothetical protein HELRODRAFT_96068 [Helobdella robusta]